MIDRWVFCRCMKFSNIFRPNHEQGEEYATTGLLAGTEPACDLAIQVQCSTASTTI